MVREGYAKIAQDTPPAAADRPVLMLRSRPRTQQARREHGTPSRTQVAGRRRDRMGLSCGNTRRAGRIEPGEVVLISAAAAALTLFMRRTQGRFLCGKLVVLETRLPSISARSCTPIGRPFEPPCVGDEHVKAAAAAEMSTTSPGFNAASAAGCRTESHVRAVGQRLELLDGVTEFAGELVGVLGRNRSMRRRVRSSRRRCPGRFWRSLRAPSGARFLLIFGQWCVHCVLIFFPGRG